MKVYKEETNSPTSVYLSLGTNLGDKEENLNAAMQEIERLVGSITSQSAFYVTEPWGFVSANSFLNAVVEVQTTLSPLALLDTTQSIERSLGRKQKSIGRHYTDRLIDIDILFYGDLTMMHARLTLPHPLMHLRKFVLEPLAEIAPNLVHPLLHKDIRTLLATCRPLPSPFSDADHAEGD